MCDDTMLHLVLPVIRGGLTQAAVYEDHEDGVNWLARIDLDPEGPGGFTREFCRKSSGEFKYVITGLKPGDAVEFGADLCEPNGRRSFPGAYRKRKEHLRWYGVVLEITAHEMVLASFPTGSAAVLNGRVALAEYREWKSGSFVEPPKEEECAESATPAGEKESSTSGRRRSGRSRSRTAKNASSTERKGKTSSTRRSRASAE